MFSFISCTRIEKIWSTKFSHQSTTFRNSIVRSFSNKNYSHHLQCHRRGRALARARSDREAGGIAQCLCSTNVQLLDPLSSPLTSSATRPRFISTLSPQDAGKMAHEERSKRDHHKEEGEAATATDKKVAKSCEAVTMDTMLAHAGLMTDSSNHQTIGNSNWSSSRNEPLSPPLHLESTYTRPPSGDYFDESDGGRGWVYSRMGNPTRTLLEETISMLEYPSSSPTGGGSTASASTCHNKAVTCAFSSGMAAAAAVVMALPQPLHIILPDDVYHGVPSQLKTVFQYQRDVTYSSVDMTADSGANIMAEIDDIVMNQNSPNRPMPVKHILVWMESPSNPLCKVTDIKGVCDRIALRQEENRAAAAAAATATSASGSSTPPIPMITTLVDSTWAPPCLTQPLLLGADVVLHSGTKYLGGHSDVLLGTVTTSPHTSMGRSLGGSSSSSSTSSSSLRSIQTSLGSVASPLDCWLTLRGLRTLHLRVERQCDNALALATWLSSLITTTTTTSQSSSLSSIVTKVHYPGLLDHPQHNIATRQMRKGYYGGMFSFELKNEAMAMAVAGAVSTIKRATSLGGTETLIEHRASIEPEDGRVSPDGLLRVSVGLENVEDLKRDLSRALEIAQDVVGKE